MALFAKAAEAKPAPAAPKPEAKPAPKAGLSEVIDRVKDAKQREDLARAAVAEATRAKQELIKAAETVVANEKTDVANAQKAQEAAGVQLAEQQKALERAQANLKLAQANTAEQQRQLKEAEATLASLKGEAPPVPPQSKPGVQGQGGKR